MATPTTPPAIYAALPRRPAAVLVDLPLPQDDGEYLDRSDLHVLLDVPLGPAAQRLQRVHSRAGTRRCKSPHASSRATSRSRCSSSAVPSSWRCTRSSTRRSATARSSAALDARPDVELVATRLGRAANTGSIACCVNKHRISLLGYPAARRMAGDKQTFTGRHLVNLKLTGSGSEKDTRHHEIAIDGAPVSLPARRRARCRSRTIAGAGRRSPRRDRRDRRRAGRRRRHDCRCTQALTDVYNLKTPSRRLLELLVSRGATESGAAPRQEQRRAAQALPQRLERSARRARRARGPSPTSGSRRRS